MMSVNFEENEPVMMLDGKLGLVIRLPTERHQQYGIQVPGEEDIRWRDVKRFSAEPLPHEIAEDEAQR